MALNLFPVRVPIGQGVDSNGRKIDVLMTPEFSRALSDLLTRVGGESGTASGDIEALAYEALMQYPVLVEQDMPAPAPEIAVLTRQLDEVRRQVQELTIAMQGQPASKCSCANAEMLTYAMAGSASTVDWQRPGKIGFKVPNSGKFTTLTASGAVALSPANANVVISPTGTGIVTISPNGAGTMNNVDIGNTIPRSVAGTTLTTTGTFSLYNGLLRSSGTTGLQFDGASTTANAEAFLENTNAAFILHASSSGAVVKTIDFCATGAATVHFSIASTGTTTTGTHTVSGGFGCNGKAAQTAYALGAAATDLPTVITLANNLRTMAINNGIGS